MPRAQPNTAFLARAHNVARASDLSVVRDIPSATIIANKILLKTIKISIGDCSVYIPKVIRLFFKPLLALITKL